MKLLKTVFIVFIVFIIGFLPIIIIKVFVDTSMQHPDLHIFPMILFYALSVINPFIYAFNNKTYKDAFIKLYQYIFCRHVPILGFNPGSFSLDKFCRNSTQETVLNA